VKIKPEAKVFVDAGVAIKDGAFFGQIIKDRLKTDLSGRLNERFR
jgi:hypothetical protein